MGNYLLDTNHISRLIMRDHPLHQYILGKIDEGHNFAICVPVLTEMLFGIGILPRAAQNLEIWKKIKSNFPCYLPNETDAEVAADLQISLRRRGRQLETVDALIAAVALRNDFSLLTTDKDFLAVPNLQIENWLI